MTFAVRLLVLAVALLALALTTATSFAGRNARARAEAGAEAQRAAPPSPRDQRPASRLADARPATATGSGGQARLLARAEAASTSGVARRPSATTDRPRAATAPRATLLRVRAGRTVAVRGRPGGDVIGRLSARTEFGSPQVVSAVKRRGRWLGVASTVRTDGRLGWVDGSSSALRPTPARFSIRADLSQRRVVLRRGDRVTARVRVAIGRPGSGTPTGRFTITDKLDGDKLTPYYGCCVLALSGTQPNLPVGWSGGNRLAIHGTNDPGSIGQRASAGCLRAGDDDMRELMRRVPLGTPVEIRN